MLIVIHEGTGIYPAADPFGCEFSQDYMPQRWKLAGKRISGQFLGVFDAVQADLEFVRKVFNLQRTFEAIYVTE